MGRSPIAIWTPTTSFKATETKKQGVCLHHMAGVSDNLVGTFNSRRVSTQYSAGVTGVIRQYVDEAHISWATGTMLGNNSFINIEISNSGGAPNWPISELTMGKAVELIVEIAKRNGFYPLIAGQNLRQHKAFMATYCAGRAGDMLEEIARWVNAIITSDGASAATVSPPDGAASYPIVRKGSTGDYVRIVQRLVSITADGIFGALTEKSVKAYQRSKGLSADGIVGPATWKAMLGSSNAKEPDRAISPPKAKPVLRIGSKGEDVKLVQKVVGINADGVFGNLTNAAVKAYQKRKGLIADGIVGALTWKAMGY